MQKAHQRRAFAYLVPEDVPRLEPHRGEEEVQANL